MRFIEGNLINLALAGEYNVIIHECDCFHGMKSAINQHIIARFPDVKKIDDRTPYGDESKLGTINYYKDDSGLYIVNAYTQIKPGPFIRYDALESCFHSIKTQFTGLTFGIPQIGGRCCGDWNIINGIIKYCMKDEKIEVVVKNLSETEWDFLKK